MDQAAVKALEQAAGRENFSADSINRLLYASDGTGKLHPPEAVVRATDTAQVSRVMAACHRHGIPVTPRGSGSGLTGGALAIKGGVILDMTGLNRIIAINPEDQTARVEPGVITAELQAAAQAKGLMYPPDPASVRFCSIGGNVAENAGGLRAVKYGVTRDYVMAVKAVLPDGSIFETGKPTIKGVVGYDLTRLLVGSEGTLAVLMEITLRLLPQPEAKRTLNGLFKDLDQSARAVHNLLSSGLKPVALEFMDQTTLKAVEQSSHLGIGPEYQAMILVDLDGPPEVLNRQAEEAAAILSKAGGDPVRIATTQEESDQLWEARRSVSTALYQLSKGKTAEDIVIPLGSLVEMVRRLQKISEERKLTIAVFGHAGDGNLHVNILHDPDSEEDARNLEETISDVFAHTLSLKGSLSGEHGVGTLKLGYVGAEIDPVSLTLMRGIKQVFDPKGILNPGKAIPSPEALGE